MAKDSAKVTCRCHGVSGTCSSKTCSNKIDKFNVVAKNLVKSYKKHALKNHDNFLIRTALFDDLARFYENAKRVRLNPRTKELVDRKNKSKVYRNFPIKNNQNQVLLVSFV